MRARAAGYLMSAGEDSVVWSVETLQEGNFGTEQGFVAPCLNGRSF